MIIHDISFDHNQIRCLFINKEPVIYNFIFNMKEKNAFLLYNRILKLIIKKYQNIFIDSYNRSIFNNFWTQSFYFN